MKLKKEYPFIFVSYEKRLTSVDSQDTNDTVAVVKPLLFIMKFTNYVAARSSTKHSAPSPFSLSAYIEDILVKKKKKYIVIDSKADKQIENSKKI